MKQTFRRIDHLEGFKLHLIVNDQGELLAVFLTLGGTDDREGLPQMTQALFGQRLGDRGYVSQQLFERLSEQGLELITTLATKYFPIKSDQQTFMDTGLD